MNDIKKYTLENCEVVVDNKMYVGNVIVNSIIDNGIEILLNCTTVRKMSINVVYQPINIKDVSAVIRKGTITKTEIIGTQTKIMLHNLVENLENHAQI